MLVARTVTLEQLSDVANASVDEGSQTPIESLRERFAYVLLGDPGIGKSSAFEVEAAAHGTKPIKAHDFIALSQSFSDWSSGPIFIDGLDETRAGSKGGRTSLDAIRGKLDAMGRPPFRLSCRSWNWLGDGDKAAIQKLMPDSIALEIAHLDPLTLADVERILRENFAVASPQEFIASAEENRITELLFNPQTLGLLSEAVSNGEKWPSSRLETYELACKKLVSEQNIEHRAEKRSTEGTSRELFDAAGYLCAIQLISDIQSFSMDVEDATQTLGLGEIANPEKLPLSMALGSRVFHSLGNGLFEPTHRSIAEFLAAKFIAKRIASSLPPARVCALICGTDGEVVSELRAFAAWLSVFSDEFRVHQIEYDPVGLLIYGDAKGFAAEDKIAILNSIKRLGDSGVSINWNEWHELKSEVLGTPEMAGEFERILESKPVTQGDQLVADCVVDAIYRSDGFQELGAILVKVARNAGWWGGIRRFALKAALAKNRIDDNAAKLLLDDVWSGKVKDEDDELLGVLLDNLYPTIVGPSEIVTYFRARKQSNLLGNYFRFWQDGLLRKSTDGHLGSLLGTLAKWPRMKWSNENRQLWSSLGEIVAKGVERQGDCISDETLYEWLGICLDERDHDHIDADIKQRIGKWFQDRPLRYKGVLLVALDRTPDSDFLYQRIDAHLLDAPAPVDIGVWWLGQADLAKSEARAKVYFHQSFRTDLEGNIHGGLSIELLEQWVNQRPIFADLLTERMSCDLTHEGWRKDDRKRSRERVAKRQDRILQFRSALEKTSPGNLDPQTLYYLALAYLGHLGDAEGDTPDQRLAHFLGDSVASVAVAKFALCEVVSRRDLPLTAAILELNRKDKVYYLTPALLAGLDLIWRSEPQRFAMFAESLLKCALTSHFVYTTNSEVKWFDFLVTSKPELVAEALIEYLLARIRQRKEHIHGPYQLAHDDKFGGIAKLVVPKVLREMPIRTPNRFLSLLEYLLKAAIKHVPPSALLSTIESRLSQARADVAQRTYLLATATILKPAVYLVRLAEYVEMKKVRLAHLGNFLYGGHGVVGPSGELSTQAIGKLVELLAPTYSPERYASADGIVTAGMNRAELVRSWINKLASDHDPNAGLELQRLFALPALAEWSATIGRALAQHKVARRDYEFVHPSHEQVSLTLYKGPPANSSDIAAIVNETIRALAIEVCTSPNNIYRQFWNVDSHGRETDPRPEETCRDVLAELLKPRLKKYEIECLTEVRHVGEKRSDIWCMFGNIGVPIEIKRDCHKELWEAIEDQLIAKYIIDPRAQGVGVYVVLWFGDGAKVPSLKGKRKPESASELYQQLSARVPEKHHKSIQVHVLNTCLDLD